MAKVKKMMFGGVSGEGPSFDEVSKMPGGINPNTPPEVRALMDKLAAGKSVGPQRPQNTLNGLKNLANRKPAMEPAPVGPQNAVNLKNLGNIKPAMGPAPVGPQTGLGRAVSGGMPPPAPSKPPPGPGMTGLGAAMGSNPAMASNVGGMGAGMGAGMGMKKGGKVKSASARADGCAIRGKTRA
jgi:hypothetical protein